MISEQVANKLLDTINKAYSAGVETVKSGGSIGDPALNAYLAEQMRNLIMLRAVMEFVLEKGTGEAQKVGQWVALSESASSGGHNCPVHHSATHGATHGVTGQSKKWGAGWRK